MMRCLWLLLCVLSRTLGECFESSKIKIAYLLLAHDSETLRASARLLDAIYEENNLYFVHVDLKYSPLERSLIEALRVNRTNVEWGQLFDVCWARWSMIEPTLWAMEKASRKDYDYFINLSGDSWPVLTQPALKQALASLGPSNFVASAPQSPTGLRPTARSEFGDGWHKKQAYPKILVEAFPDMEAYFGSQWMIVHRTFVDDVLGQLLRDDAPASLLRDWFKFATIDVEGVGRVKPHIPDETFFPTLLMFKQRQKVPEPLEVYDRCDVKKVLRTAFYIRMDEHYPWSPPKQRYAAPTLDKKERPWGPYYLGAYDLQDIKDFGSFFIRKVSKDVDPTLFDILPVEDHDHIPNIAWPNHAHLALSLPDPLQQKVTRGQDKGCIRVAESIHCPPNHTLRADVQQAEDNIRRLLLSSSSRDSPITQEEDDSEL